MRLAVLAALLLLATLPFDPVVPDEVEAVEVNHYNCVPGLNSGSQLLFWEVQRGVWLRVHRASCAHREPPQTHSLYTEQ